MDRTWELEVVPQSCRCTTPQQRISHSPVGGCLQLLHFEFIAACRTTTALSTTVTGSSRFRQSWKQTKLPRVYTCCWYAYSKAAWKACSHSERTLAPQQLYYILPMSDPCIALMPSTCLICMLMITTGQCLASGASPGTSWLCFATQLPSHLTCPLVVLQEEVPVGHREWPGG